MRDDLGIYEEARRRAEYHAAQSPALRRKILGLGPAPNGATAEVRNPFEPPPRVPTHALPPYWSLHSHTRVRRRLERGTLYDDIDVNPLQIVQVITRITGLTVAELLGERRPHRFSHPRQAAIYFIARYCGELSLKQIAYIFSKDHTTVMHAITAVPGRIDRKHGPTRALVEEIEAQLRMPR